MTHNWSTYGNIIIVACVCQLIFIRHSIILCIILSIPADSHTEEYRKLEGKKDVLVDAIADAKCIPSLAMELHSMGMIPKSVYTKANTHALEVTDLTHAQVIIDAMLPEVDRPHPEGRDNYDKLLRALHKNDSDLAKILDGMKLY